MSGTVEATRGRSVLFVAFAVAVATRLGLFLAVVGHPSRFSSPDTTQYVGVATHLHAALLGGSHSSWFELGLRRTPVYPVLIGGVYALFGRHPTAVVLVQIALSLVTLWLLAALCRRLVGPTVAAFAVLALALDPISIILTNYVQPEVLFTLLLVAGALAWTRAIQERSWRLGVAAGLLFGVAALTRPIAVYFLVALVPITLVLVSGPRARRVLITATIVAGFAIPVGAWMTRNAVTTGVPLVSTIEGTNMLLYRAAPALAKDEGISVATARARLARDLDRRVGVHANVAERSRAATALSISTLLHHPKGTIVTDAKGLGTLLIGPGRAELLRLTGGDVGRRPHSFVNRAIVGFTGLVYGLIALAAVVGVVLLVRRRRYPPILIAGGVILYFLVFSAGADAYSRLRVPIMPFFALFAGVSLAALAARRVTPAREPHAPDAQGELPDPAPLAHTRSGAGG